MPTKRDSPQARANQATREGVIRCTEQVRGKTVKSIYVRVIEAGMTLLPDSEALYREWRRIVVQHGVSEIQAHDARLAAARYVHG